MLELTLKRGMTVRLVDRTSINEMAKKFGYLPKVEVGERGVILTDEQEDGLAECRFADCTMWVNRAMVDLA